MTRTSRRLRPAARRRRSTRSSSTRARSRLPRTSTSASRSCSALTMPFEPERPDQHAIADRRRALLVAAAALPRRSDALDPLRSRSPIASIAARASARAAPMSPVGTSRAARRSASAASAPVRPFSASTTESISRRASRSRSSIRSSSRLRNVSSRSRSSCSRACSLAAASRSSVSRSRADQPALVLERLHVALAPWPGARPAATRARVRCARAWSMIDGRQPEPGRDLERQAAARRAVVQPIRRRERLRD